MKPKDEGSRMNAASINRKAVLGARLLVCLAPAMLLACKSKPAATQPSTRPTSAIDRQEAAKKDPFNYSPWKDDSKRRVSGGGIGEYDKDGMKGDMKRLLDP